MSKDHYKKNIDKNDIAGLINEISYMIYQIQEKEITIKSLVNELENYHHVSKQYILDELNLNKKV